MTLQYYCGFYKPELWLYWPVGAHVDFDIFGILASGTEHIQGVNRIPWESMFLEHSVAICCPLPQEHVICSINVFIVTARVVVKIVVCLILNRQKEERRAVKNMTSTIGL